MSSGGTLTYEVTLQVEAELVPDYRRWLKAHVAQMLALPGFQSATIERQIDIEADHSVFIVRYRMHDRAALDRYLREHAPAMRADGERRFGGRFRATRRVLIGQI